MMPGAPVRAGPVSGTAPRCFVGAMAPTSASSRRHRRLLATAAVLALAGGVTAVPPAAAKTAGPNGRIAYTELDPGTGDPHVTTVNPDGSDARTLDLGGPAGNPRWSPDGRRLAVFVFSDAGIRPAVVGADGTGLTVLRVPALPSYLDVSPCVWTPTATRLLCAVRNFTTADHSWDGIYSIAAGDGSNPVRLTVNPYPPSGEFGGGDAPGDVSPDGTRFVFMRARPDQPQAPGREQSAALYVERIDGTGLHQITDYGLPDSHDGGYESWSPDGTTILFGGEHGGVFTVRPDGSSLAAVPIRAAGSWSFAFYPTWAPDGRRIVVALYLGATRQIDLYTVAPDGSGLARVTTNGLVPADASADWGPAPG